MKSAVVFLSLLLLLSLGSEHGVQAGDKKKGSVIIIQQPKHHKCCECKHEEHHVNWDMGHWGGMFRRR